MADGRLAAAVGGVQDGILRVGRGSRLAGFRACVDLLSNSNHQR